MNTEKDLLSKGELFLDSIVPLLSAVGARTPIKIPFVVDDNGNFIEINECFITINGKQKENEIPVIINFRESGTRNCPLYKVPWIGYINFTTLVGHPEDVNNLPEFFKD